MRYLITGGAGFMGSNLVHHIIRKHADARVMVYDKLTYAGRMENLEDLRGNPNFEFVRGDICDEERLAENVKRFQPDVIVNMAGETHVDRSINRPAPFLETNVNGLFKILEVARKLKIQLVLHVSTDEIYGDMWRRRPADEGTAFKPSSPYSASKASGDLLCQAYWRTYGLPVIIARPSNNYGPYQHPEKLIPKTIIRALHDRPIPVYGKGNQVRDWLYVKDFAEAMDTIIERGSIGEVYNIPGFNERRNIEVVEMILEIMDKPTKLIRHVEDRPGHDRRYSMIGEKIRALGWRPRTSWREGLRRTICWYMDNEQWWRPLLGDDYFILDAPWRRNGRRGHRRESL